jgi:hypothetical protein
MRLIYPIAAAAIATLTLATSVKPSEALIIYQWCAHYGRNLGGAASCGFVTYAQCMASVSGNGGFCAENPWWEPQPPARRVTRRVPS